MLRYLPMLFVFLCLLSACGKRSYIVYAKSHKGIPVTPGVEVIQGGEVIGHVKEVHSVDNDSIVISMVILSNNNISNDAFIQFGMDTSHFDIFSYKKPHEYKLYHNKDTIGQLALHRNLFTKEDSLKLINQISHLLNDMDTLGSILKDAAYLVKTDYMPSMKQSVHLEEEDGYVGDMLTFGGCDITFLSSSGDYFDQVPENRLSKKCKEMIVDRRLVAGSKIYAGNTLIRLDRSTIVNAADYPWGEEGFSITMPETVTRLQGKTGELFYFIGGIRDTKLWYIGFIYQSGGKYGIKAFLAHTFEERWISTKNDGVSLLVGEGLYYADSTTMTRYDLSMDGKVKKGNQMKVVMEWNGRY